jgi:pyrrolidone-carboxylate peptidase
MRVLVYGFGPYKQFEDNITQRVVKKLPRSGNLKKIVFPVRFDKGQFTDAVKKFSPDFVLGLGQCSRGRLLRIERRAVNRRRMEKGEKARPIVSSGPKRLATTLTLQTSLLGKQAKVSTDAGDYVCNFSMYVILDFLLRRRQVVKFGFVHVPHGHDIKHAVNFIERALKTLSL